MQLQFIFILSEFLKFGQSNPQIVHWATTFFCRKQSSVLVTPYVYISWNSQVIHTDRNHVTPWEQSLTCVENAWAKTAGHVHRAEAGVHGILTNREKSDKSVNKVLSPI